MGAGGDFLSRASFWTEFWKHEEDSAYQIMERHSRGWQNPCPADNVLHPVEENPETDVGETKHWK